MQTLLALDSHEAQGQKRLNLLKANTDLLHLHLQFEKWGHLCIFAFHVSLMSGLDLLLAMYSARCYEF